MDKEFKKMIKAYEKRLCKIVKDRDFFAISFEMENPTTYKKIRVEAGSWMFKSGAGFSDDYQEVKHFHDRTTDTLNWVCNNLANIEEQMKIAMDVYDKELEMKKKKQDKCRNNCIKNITEYLGD